MSAASVIAQDVYVVHAPRSAPAESVRATLARLDVTPHAHDQPAIAIVGCAHGEGRSTLVANLAAAAAQAGETVLIVDAARSAADQHARFGERPDTTGPCAIAAVPGLTVTRHTADGHRLADWLIDAPARFGAALTDFAATYDRVFVDVTVDTQDLDATNAAAQAGAALVFMRRDTARLGRVRQLVARLEHSGTRLLGSVLGAR